MGAAVQHGMDSAVIAAGDDDRRLAEKRRQIVARLRQFPGQGQELPGRAEEDVRKFGPIDVRVGKHPVGNPRIPLGRPLQLCLVPHRSLLLGCSHPLG